MPQYLFAKVFLSFEECNSHSVQLRAIASRQAATAGSPSLMLQIFMMKAKAASSKHLMSHATRSK